MYISMYFPFSLNIGFNCSGPSFTPARTSGHSKVTLKKKNYTLTVIDEERVQLTTLFAKSYQSLPILIIDFKINIKKILKIEKIL
jgi:hypothetical protein